MTERDQVRHALNGVIKAMGLPNAEATDKELADLVWLTYRLTEGLRAPEPVDADQTSADSAVTGDSVTGVVQEKATGKLPAKTAEGEEQRQARIQSEARYRRQSHVSDAEAFLPALGAGRKETDGRSGWPLMLPAPPALENKTALARSLRPLKRRVPSRTRSIIDEAATVLQIAEADTWFPVLRPLPEKWLDVVLLIDRWNTMAVWHRLIAEFRQMLTDVGVFQQVTVYSLETKRTVGTEPYRAEIHTLLRAGKRTRQIMPRELADSSGRRLFLVVTDGMAPIWQSGAAATVLEPLYGDNYLALVDVLPSNLWEYSGLGHASLTTVWAGWHRTANRELRRLRPWYLDEDTAQEGTPLPVMSLTPASVGRWAQIVAGETTARMPSFVLPTEPSGRPAARDHWVKSVAGALAPEKRLEYFDEIASPTAWTLAGQLAAVAPLTLPVMRLIQQFHLPQSDATHQAEILHAGLLRLREGDSGAGDPELVQYDFQSGLRSKLRRRVSGAELFQLVRLNAHYIDRQRGGGVFQAALTGLGGSQQLQIDADSLPFAQVAVDVLRELGSRYEQFANLFAGAIDQYENPDRYLSGEEQAARLKALVEQIAQIDHVTVRTEREIDGIREPMAEAQLDLLDGDVQSKWFGEAEATWTDIHQGTADIAEKLHTALLQTVQGLIEQKSLLAEPPDGTELPYMITTDDALAIDWCWVPKGTFTMGGEQYSDERPIHEVNVDGFWMMRYPVTNAQYGQFIEAGGYTEKRWWTDAGWRAREENGWTEPHYWNDTKWNDERQPVVGVSWYETVAFCRWASSVTGQEVRLPAEAEWEKAARGTDGREYPWGNAEPNEDLCNFNRNVGQTTPVGQYSPEGDGPYGCVDMAGNVREWVQDWYQAYPGNTAEDDQYRNFYGEKYKVLRGGSWNYVRNFVRAADRDRFTPDFRSDLIGFRCASTPF